VIGPAREREIVDTPAPQFEPFQQACTSVIYDLKLYRTPSLLNNDCAVTDIVIADDVADRDLIRSQPRSLLSIARSKSAPSHLVTVQDITPLLNIRGRHAPKFASHHLAWDAGQAHIQAGLCCIYAAPRSKCEESAIHHNTEALQMCSPHASPLAIEIRAKRFDRDRRPIGKG